MRPLCARALVVRCGLTLWVAAALQLRPLCACRTDFGEPSKDVALRCWDRRRLRDGHRLPGGCRSLDHASVHSTLWLGAFVCHLDVLVWVPARRSPPAPGRLCGVCVFSLPLLWRPRCALQSVPQCARHALVARRLKRATARAKEKRKAPELFSQPEIAAQRGLKTNVAAASSLPPCVRLCASLLSCVRVVLSCFRFSSVCRFDCPSLEGELVGARTAVYAPVLAGSGKNRGLGLRLGGHTCRHRHHHLVRGLLYEHLLCEVQHPLQEHEEPHLGAQPGFTVASTRALEARLSARQAACTYPTDMTTARPLGFETRQVFRKRRESRRFCLWCCA